MTPNVDPSSLVYCPCVGRRVPYGECAGSICDELDDTDESRPEEYEEPENDDQEPPL